MQISKGGTTRQATPWEQMQIQRARRRAHIDQFRARQQALASQFAQIRQTETTGFANLSTRMAVQRLSKTV